ncbi:MAG: helix-turn-helix domain-containing protein [Aeromicrobium sp.]
MLVSAADRRNEVARQALEEWDVVMAARTRNRTVGAAAGQDQQLRREAGPLTGKGQARKVALLDAARRVFEEQGFIDARVSDIATEAGVAQGTFYTYFDSKEAVFQAIAARVADDMMLSVRPKRERSGRAYDRTRAAIESFVEVYRLNARMIALIEQVGTFTPELKEVRLQVREAFVDEAARGIRRLQTEREAEIELDPALTAEVLGAMIEQICFVWMNLGKDFDEKELLHTLTTVWLRCAGQSAPDDSRHSLTS